MSDANSPIKKYLMNLLDRMEDDSYREGEIQTEGVFEGGKTVSAAAHEEVEKLQDRALLGALMDLIPEEQDEDKRQNAYFILGWLARNTRDIEAKQFLVSSLSRETETHMLVTILDRLAKVYKPASIDLAPIFELTDYNFRIRHAAYKALTNSEEPMEDFLLERLKEAPKDDLTCLITALMYVGTSNSLPYIMKHTKSRNGWIYSFSRNAVTVIMLREGAGSEEIEQKIQVSADWVSHHVERLMLFTHPDRNV